MGGSGGELGIPQVGQGGAGGLQEWSWRGWGGQEKIWGIRRVHKVCGGVQEGSGGSWGGSGGPGGLREFWRG